MRIAVVEDDPSVQDLIISYIDRFYQEEKSRYTVTRFADGDEIAENYPGGFDVIFLDIEMRFMDGMTAARQIRKMDETVPIVFITNLAQYAIKGYSVHAYDFILKPVNYYMLEQILNNLEKQIEQRDKRHIMLPTSDGMVRLSVWHIWYVESEAHYLTIHCEKGSYTMRETMKNMEKTLAQYHFFRCNNCYLVNLECVEQVNGSELTMRGGDIITISRPKYHAFMEALTLFLGREG